MHWLSLWFALQFGLCPVAGMIEYNPEVLTLHEGALFTELEAEVRIASIFFVGGVVRTDMQAKMGELSFVPELASYGFFVGARWKGIEVGFSHTCQHPSVPYYNYYHPVINWDGVYEQIYVKISGEVKF